MYDRIVKDFLTLRLKKGANLLLGLSGGPDSMALLHFLMEAKKELDFSLHVAHVDHGWREESGREAESLCRVAAHYSLPFYLHRLEKMEGGDLENRSRNERLKFFRTLHAKHHYQALLLAHHSGDQAETVFKRVAEGAGLRGLGGLYEERSIENLSVWRPLLSLKKEDLLAYLHKKKLYYFEDSTNQDPKYLRSRMRETLFPTLEEIFGKRMEGNFARIGKMCQELADYFEEKGEEIEKKLVYGPFGAYLDLEQGIHSVELKYYLKGLAPFSHDALEVLMKLTRERRCSRLIQAGSGTFQVTRSHLFIYQNPFPDFFEKSELWTEGANGDWKEFWQGRVKIREGVSLKRLSEIDPIIKRKLKKWFAAHRVPSFFYDKAPIFTKGDKVVGDSLTGKNLNILL
ncbi:MAG: tRNA lysidine(34) synthetase TilS [Simkaniaceae bacterium]|nr:MAG: tRNA lysidine(34) synthetase TilS [Simkaniaceae bacterium]